MLHFIITDVFKHFSLLRLFSCLPPQHNPRLLVCLTCLTFPPEWQRSSRARTGSMLLTRRLHAEPRRGRGAVNGTAIFEVMKTCSTHVLSIRGAVTLNQKLSRNYRLQDGGTVWGEGWNGMLKIVGWLKVTFCRSYDGCLTEPSKASMLVPHWAKLTFHVHLTILWVSEHLWNWEKSWCCVSFFNTSVCGTLSTVCDITKSWLPWPWM